VRRLVGAAALAAWMTLVGACAPDMTFWEVTRVRGELKRTMSGYELKLCGSSEPRAVKDFTHGDLPGLWRTLGVHPSSALFVEANLGSSSSNPELRIHEILRAQPAEGPGCEEDWAYEVRAHGNEPFWGVTVKQEGIVFEQPDEPTRIEFPHVRPMFEMRSPSFSRTYRTVSGSDTLVLRLDRRRCQDGMSGFIFPLTAEARFRGRELHGCASEGAPR